MLDRAELHLNPGLFKLLCQSLVIFLFTWLGFDSPRFLMVLESVWFEGAVNLFDLVNRRKKTTDISHFTKKTLFVVIFSVVITGTELRALCMSSRYNNCISSCFSRYVACLFLDKVSPCYPGWLTLN